VSMTPLRIASIYLILALLWILFSDRILHMMVEDGSALRQWQTLKGWAFVTLTSVLIYYLSKRLQQVLLRELDAKRRHLSQLRHKGYTDYLTHLPNRRMGLRQLRRILRERHRTRKPFGILYIDLDNFKQINDSLGHSGGDRVIVAVAQRLQKLLAADEHLIRQSGDEFVWFVEHIPSPDYLADCAQRVIDVLAAPVQLEHASLQVTPSIGISRFPDDGETVSQLMRRADLALHHAKKYKNCFKIYDSSMNNTLQYRFDIEQKLRKAIAEQRLQVFFQPIYDPSLGTFAGAEALLRWPDGDGFISPAQFIPVAEHSGQIRALGASVLLDACRITNQLSQQLGRDLTISVNVSPQQFVNCNILTDVREALEISGLDPRSLVLEITEGIFLSNLAETDEVLAKLTAMGVSLAMDDFGKGYSSLSYLRDLSVDALKLDKSFVLHLHERAEDRSIVNSTVRMAHELKLEVVAEGVETEWAARYLAAAGYDYAQGFCYSFGQDMLLLLG
jgi:diguanylate cyclase (GGDEF)-like protein